MQRFAWLALLCSACNFSVKPATLSTTQPDDLAVAADVDLAGAPPDMALAPPGDMAMAPTPPDLLPAPSLCAALTGALCDGFESGSPASFWTPHQTRGSLAVDTNRAYRGTHSLHVHSDALNAGQSSDVRLGETMTFTGTGGAPPDVYVRAFFFVPAAPANAAQLLTALESSPPNAGVGINLDTGNLAAFDSVTNGYVKGTHALPLGRWSCVTWQIHLAQDATGSVSVYVDGTEIPELHTTGATESMNGAGTFSVGFSFFQPAAAQQATDAWVDEVAIGPNPITCTE